MEKRDFYIETENELKKNKLFNPIIIRKNLDRRTRSEEVYFGTKSPLSMILLEHSHNLKNLLTEDFNFKNNKKIEQLKELNEVFCRKLERELNVEKVVFMVSTEPYDNAFTYSMILNKNVYKKNNKTLIDFDKYVDLENIYIDNTGYHFRNFKQKTIYIQVTHGCILKNDEYGISATICHELGHCFQSAVFGYIKEMSDSIYRNHYENIKDRLKNPTFYKHGFFTKFVFQIPLLGFIFKNFSVIVSYFFNPAIFSEGIFSGVGVWIEKNILNRVATPTLRIRNDVLHEKDNNKKKDALKKLDANFIPIETDRDKLINDQKKMVEKGYKEYTKVDEKNEYKGFLFNFFNYIRIHTDMLEDNIISLLFLSKYTLDTYEKEVYYRKYEHFADIFASAYGFGNGIKKSNTNYEVEIEKDLSKMMYTGLYNVPLIGLIDKYTRYQWMKNRNETGVHGTTADRNKAVYTALLKEVQTNKDLSITQKKEILETLELMEKSDEDYREEMQQDPFLRFYFNKMLERRKNTYTIDADVVTYILEPIDQILKESKEYMKKNRKK